jgi:hypothetical protein
MRIHVRRAVLLLVGLVLLGACAGGGRVAPVYQRDIGNASRADLLSRAMLILTRFHYEVHHQELDPEIRIETHWRERPPFADEQVLGITHGENKVTVLGRVRGEAMDASVYHIRMVVENRVRVAGGIDWNETVQTPMFRAYADSMTVEFRREISNIGVRAY